MTVGKHGQLHHFVSYPTSWSRIVDMYLQMIRSQARNDNWFYDKWSVTCGSCLTPAIESGIDACSVFHLFWCKEADASRWVTLEWQRALNRTNAPEFRIYVLDGSDPPAEFKDIRHVNMYAGILTLVIWFSWAEFSRLLRIQFITLTTIPALALCFVAWGIRNSGYIGSERGRELFNAIGLCILFVDIILWMIALRGCKTSRDYFWVKPVVSLFFIAMLMVLVRLTFLR